jgi:hypothetical protein
VQSEEYCDSARDGVQSVNLSKFRSEVVFASSR